MLVLTIALCVLNCPVGRGHSCLARLLALFFPQTKTNTHTWDYSTHTQMKNNLHPGNSNQGWTAANEKEVLVQCDYSHCSQVDTLNDRKSVQRAGQKNLSLSLSLSQTHNNSVSC